MQPYNLAFIESISAPKQALIHNDLSKYQFILQNRKLLKRVLSGLHEAGIEIEGAMEVYESMCEALQIYKTAIDEGIFYLSNATNLYKPKNLAQSKNQKKRE